MSSSAWFADVCAELASSADTGATGAYGRALSVPATNHNAERAIRPQVCTRKSWGGNKSLDGAAASTMIGSVLRTATQQRANPIEVLISLATSDGARSDLDLRTGRGP
jgi:hypothetical protein